MSSTDWKWVSLSKLFNFGKEKSYMGKDLVSMAYGGLLVFVFRLRTGRFFGTILAHTFFMFKFVVKICLTISFSTFISSVIILMPQWQSVLTRVLNFSTFSSDFIVTRWPGCSSSSHPLLLLKTSCAIQTHGLLMFSPYVSHNKLIVSVAVFFNFTRNLMLTSWYSFYEAWLWQVKKYKKTDTTSM